jgi:hypothetical protein
LTPRNRYIAGAVVAAIAFALWLGLERISYY